MGKKWKQPTLAPLCLVACRPRRATKAAPPFYFPAISIVYFSPRKNRNFPTTTILQILGGLVLRQRMRGKREIRTQKKQKKGGGLPLPSQRAVEHDTVVLGHGPRATTSPHR
ncbi:hypothetical protein SESBI_29120 [Sesbania bispinosa]|nr:hypothetical protein SESBI_29120 [Sesbania bispinosa]